jgi:hypothetical protein
MKSIGSLLFLFGAAAIVLGFMDRVPSVLQWIYNWGDGAAWAIKIGLLVAGAGLYLAGSRKKKEEAPAETANP